MKLLGCGDRQWIEKGDAYSAHIQGQRYCQLPTRFLKGMLVEDMAKIKE